MSSPDRRAQLRDLYGFDFPDDLFRFWDFAKRLRPLEPLRALEDVTHSRLVGPFEVLAGHFDGRTPRYSPHLHWRFWMDSPEFFTVIVGDTDGLHWGYWFDDPDAAPDGDVAHYWASDAFEFAADGATLFEAVRTDLEHHHGDCEDYLEDDPEAADDYQADLKEIDRARRVLMRFATGRRTTTGQEYVDRWGYRSKRPNRITAKTPEGMGIVVPPERYRRLSLSDAALRKRLGKERNPADLVAEARRALAEGFPGTALKLGKELWAVAGKDRRARYAAELLDEAYLALGRHTLRRVLAEHVRHRDRPSLDIFDAPDANGDGVT
jgi:hypothetical protein